MQLISAEFFICFIAGVLVYYVLPAKMRCLWLLLLSAAFYLSQDMRYAAFLLLSVVLTYAGARFLQNMGTGMQRKVLFCLLLAANLSLLGYFKYAGFLTGGKIRSSFVPIGISFYTFASTGYLIDIYRRKYRAERNFIRYALFVSFFPTIMSGPIERADRLLPQFTADFQQRNLFDTDKLRDALVKMFKGLFLKCVAADQLGVIVSTVFNAPDHYGGAILFLASLAYTLQIYFDFYGYSCLAQGMAAAFGIRVTDNFKTPYWSENIAGFWRRWHISLSEWFRDYLYIPLGGNRKGTVRKYINIMIVFLISGLWHGADWTFLVWGCLHGAYQVMGSVLRPVRKKLLALANGNKQTPGLQCWRVFFTFMLVNFAWIFFRADSMKDAATFISGFRHPQVWEIFDGTLFQLGLSRIRMLFLLVWLGIAVTADRLEVRGLHLTDKVKAERAWVRWPAYAFLVMVVLIFGRWGAGYDASSFIYNRF